MSLKDISSILFNYYLLISRLFEQKNERTSQIKLINYKSQDNLTNLLQLSVLSFFRI